MKLDNFRFVSDISLITIDETLIDYLPSANAKKKAEERGEPIPKIYIPRKPHKNGLEVFLACSFLDHPATNNSVLPFIIDLIPHLQVGDSAPQSVVLQVMRRYCEKLFISGGSFL